MKCQKLRDGVVCNSDYFAEATICQTAQDGRTMTLATDLRFPWVKHLTCVYCGSRYVVADKNRSNGKLIPADSMDAQLLLDEDRQDFERSFDPRQYENQEKL